MCVLYNIIGQRPTSAFLVLFDSQHVGDSESIVEGQKQLVLSPFVIPSTLCSETLFYVQFSQDSQDNTDYVLCIL